MTIGTGELLNFIHHTKNIPCYVLGINETNLLHKSKFAGIIQSIVWIESIDWSNPKFKSLICEWEELCKTVQKENFKLFFTFNLLYLSSS